ncbi:hypothetical protein [Clostridium lundense]|uniref:hypothetical protein n=1 Tax=Clostridium lundense TaxID=319475 RepID=UPI000480C1B7|nr:hypothetical protein [Clostridium lundense]
MDDNINLKITKSGTKSKEENYFKRNRFIKEDILAKFEKIETIDEIIYLDILFNDELEIYLNDKQEITRDLIKEILAEIPTFDNYVQNFCELNYNKSSFDARNYMVALSWISIEQNKAVMRYWGEYVNIELEAIFIKNNLGWENKDIYYC